MRDFLRGAAFLHNSNSNIIIQSLSSINQLVGRNFHFRRPNLMISTKLCLDPTYLLLLDPCTDQKGDL